MAEHVRWYGDYSSRDSSSTSSHNSGGGSDRSSSSRTHSTAPTDCSARRGLSRQHQTCYGRVEGRHAKPYHEDEYNDSRFSFDTHDSGPSDNDDLFDDDEDDDDDDADVVDDEDDGDDYDAPDLPNEAYRSDAIPSGPREFAAFFPSSRRMSIRHDDATLDGNMNLRVDTATETRSGSKRQMTLFHLRMHDLKSRDFSLRRYCRDSGREVCHSVRKYQKPASERRPALQKSLSSALAPFRKHESKQTAVSNLKRYDSGYGSLCGGEDDDAGWDPCPPPKQPPRIPTNTVKLEFSNYAHVDVRRRGTGAQKRYDFEYWGVNYSWKRHVRQDGAFEEVSFHLSREDRGGTLAHIVPVALTTTQAREEQQKGGWVPPCSMWISDPAIISGLPDIADVVVASGLIALVDDAIKRRWHSRSGRQLLLPITTRGASYKMNMEYIGPRRLIDEVFHRAGHRDAAHA